MEPMIEIAYSDDSLLRLGYDMIVPCSLYRTDGTVRAEVYPSLEQTVRTWFASCKDPMCASALQMLHDALKDRISDFGYTPSDYTPAHHLVCFAATETITPSSNAPQPYQKICEYPDLTSFAPDEDTVCYGIVCDETIVALCGENIGLREYNTSEIAVETAPAYRGRGFATDLIRTVCSVLQKKKITPLYKTDETNDPSLRAARKAGLTEVGEEYHFCFEK